MRGTQIVAVVDLHIERKGDIVPNHFEMLVIAQVLDIAPCAGEEIINAHASATGARTDEIPGSRPHR